MGFLDGDGTHDRYVEGGGDISDSIMDLDLDDATLVSFNLNL